MNSNKQKITYPYLPPGRSVEYVPADNEYMLMAKKFAKEHSLDQTMPTASVIVKDGVILATGANGSNYHEKNGCERVKNNIPTGQGYDLCEGCHHKNHSEVTAINNLKSRADAEGADLYLWGHWWCCEPCWSAVIKAGIKRVFLMEGSERLFNKESPESIVGRQFDQGK